MNKVDLFPDYKIPGAIEHHFNPYESNGGWENMNYSMPEPGTSITNSISRSIVAIGGKGFVAIAADTRLSQGYSILKRDQNKMSFYGDSCLASTGCWSDIQTMTNLIHIRKQAYLHEHGREMSTGALAQLVSIMMYNRRFFPYYTSTIVAGLTKEGNGIVYSYDPLGNCEETTYRAGGSASALLQPVLDNHVGLKNMPKAAVPEMTKERAIALIKDSFVSAAERDIYTGDSILIQVMTSDDKVWKEETFALRMD